MDSPQVYEPLEPTLKSGWLEKRPSDALRRSLPLSGWRRRWFDLTPSQLIWRTGPGQEGKGSLPLAQASIHAPCASLRSTLDGEIAVELLLWPSGSDGDPLLFSLTDCQV